MAQQEYDVTQSGGFMEITVTGSPVKRYNLRKVKVIEGNIDTNVVSIVFDDDDNPVQEIELARVSNQPTWTLNLSGINTATADIAGWVDAAP